jgi:hypothetical protein
MICAHFCLPTKEALGNPIRQALCASSKGCVAIAEAT